MIFMAENRDRVNWVRKVAEGVDPAKLDVWKLIKARERHGVTVDINKGGADIYQEVVEGMPAPRRPGFWRRFFGLEKGE